MRRPGSANTGMASNNSCKRIAATGCGTIRADDGLALVVQADGCDGLRYYHAVCGSRR